MVSIVCEDSEKLELSSLESEFVEVLDTPDVELVDSAVLGLVFGGEDAESCAIDVLMFLSYLLKAKSRSSGLLLAMTGLTLSVVSSFSVSFLSSQICPLCSNIGSNIHGPKI